MKKIIFLLSSILIMAVFVSTAMFMVKAEEITIIASGDCGAEGDNVKWKLDSAGTLTIAGSGMMTDYDYYDYYAPWYTYKTNIKNVVIGDGVTSIGDGAFEGCTSLTSIDIPDSVTSIGDDAFSDCTSLTSIDIPDGVTSIGIDAFHGCKSLTSIDIPDSVMSIGYYAFDECANLTSIDIPDGVTSIGNGVFWGCTSLTSIDIPDSVTAIGNSAFYQCESLTNIDIPDSVTLIGKYAFYDCTSLASIYFHGDAPSIGVSAFRWVTATAYYPANNPTWTKEVMQNYRGDITWVSYEGDVPTDTDDKPCSLSQLKDIDYLAFSSIAYMEFEHSKTVKENLINSGRWEKFFSKDEDITYAELCKNIANWKVLRIDELSDYNGFYAVGFENDAGEVVLAYRGSIPPDQWFDLDNFWDTHCDWIKNDLPMEILSDLGPQYECAKSIYNDLASTRDKIVLTGHSLGGGWADAISAYSGCESISFNAISLLDALYSQEPEDMGKEFRGVNKWNFIDHVSEYDVLAGRFEYYWSLNTIKPYISHQSNYSDPLLPHTLPSIVTKKADGTISLTTQLPEKSFYPQSVISNYLTFRLEYVDFGTGNSDTISHGLGLFGRRTSYGGNGNDEIITGIYADTLIGGRGDDSLDGGWGDDTYIYYIGDGYDIITDTSGNDVLKLYGIGKNDDITFEENLDIGGVDICCNGTAIASVIGKFRASNSNTFIVEWNGITSSLTAYLNSLKYSSHITVGCPVDVEIIDSEGKVVYTLYDGEVGSHYTDYGVFYVFEEENGEYGKSINLLEGYDIRIVGKDSGTMDISYHKIDENGINEQAETVSDVSVNDSFEWYVETESKSFDISLIGDLTKDGTIDVNDVLEFLDLAFAEQHELNQLNLADLDEDGDVDVDDVLSCLDLCFAS